MTTNEINIKGLENENNDSNPEELLDSAISSIKNNLNLGSIDEENIETEIKENKDTAVEEKDNLKRETLRIPEKKEKFVETKDPEVQQRINELYKKSKITEETNSLLKDELLRLTENFENREIALQNQLRDLQNRYNQDDENKTLTDLRAQYQEAISNFEYDKAQQINEKIVDFKTDIKLNELLNKSQQQVKSLKQPTKQAFYNDPNDVADANKFSSEKNENGELIRPWLQPNHPEFDNVVDMMAAISNKYIRKNQRPSISTVISEVDKIMGVGQNKGNTNTTLRHAPVLSSNTTLNAGSEQTIKLSDLEKSYANKLGVSEKDYARMRKISTSGPISMDNFR